MRITDRLLVDKVLGNIQRNTQRLSDLQDEVATGRRINKPSDDPTGTVSSLILHSTDDENQQDAANLDQAQAWLNSTDVALQDVNSILQRARELAVQGANQTLGPEETTSLANEVDQLLDHAMQLANTQNGDRYIFGGFNTRTPSFNFTDSTKTAWVYNGDNGDIQRAVAPGVKLSVNVTGDRVFPGVFDVLMGIRDDLKAHNQDSLSLDRLDELDSVHNDVLNALGEVGAKGARLDLTKNQLSAAHLNNKGSISDIEDADMSDAIVNLSAQQTALQAALATGARVIQPQLLDFLK
ncbi:MAG TPA: flagellar hook-associated protein FlgL [Chloroflexota bacterium]|nr:flagellar hook-associated protein FlgL [Chloroflexota bacterium]